MLMLWLWALPLLSSLVLLFSQNKNQIKILSLFFSVLLFLFTFSLWFLVDLNFSGFYSLDTIYWTLNSTFCLELSLGLDGMSLLFMTLSVFLMPICLLNSLKLNFNSQKNFSLIYFLLTFFLIGSFSSLNLLVFFMFFESMVPLMFLVIGVFGSSMQKMSAAHYFFMYTVFGSLLMLTAMFWLLVTFKTLNYNNLIWIQIPLQDQKLLWLAFFIALASKLPLVPFHIWLPQAHVEAPISGSVLLAGILLKLGGYGFISFVFPMFPEANLFFSPLVLTLSIVSLFYAALSTLSQTDFKSFIAYSSVSHMAVVTLGLFSLSEVAFSGSIVLMLAHGFSSSGLFMAVSLLYNSHKTSTIKYYSGLTTSMPLFSLIFLACSLANLALPLTMNFMGEILILLGLFQSFPMVGVLANLSVILSASYSLFLFNSMAFGTESIYLFFTNSDLTSVEFYSFIPLLLPLIFFGMNTDFIALIQPMSMKALFF